MSDEPPFEVPPLYDDVVYIDSHEQAANWMRHLISRCREARAACNVQYPDANATVHAQMNAFQKYLQHLGAALGTCRALHACRKLDSVAYNIFTAEARDTIHATVIGVARG